MVRSVRIFTGLVAALLVMLQPAKAKTHAEDPQPMSEELVERPDGGTSHVRIIGDPQSAHGWITLVPSLGRGVEDFMQDFGSDLATSLADRGYAVALIQPRGTGKSTGSLDPSQVTMATLAKDLEVVLDALEIESASFVGHAFGNRLSRYFAAQNPDRVDGLVLLAAGGDFELSEAQQGCLLQSFSLTLDPETRRKAIRCAFFARGNDPEIWMEGWYPRLAMAQIAAARSVVSDDFKRAGGIPFLLVQPTEDFIAPAALAGRPLIAELGDQVTYVEVAGAGHALLPEQPELLAHILGQYFDELRKRQ